MVIDPKMREASFKTLPIQSLCLRHNNLFYLQKHIFACLLSVPNITSLSRHEQVRLHMLVHNVVKLLYYITCLAEVILFLLLLKYFCLS